MAAAAAAGSGAGGSIAGGAAGGPIIFAIVIALIITKEIFKARRTERREMLKKKYPPIQIASAALRLKNILGENGEALAVVATLTAEQQLNIGPPQYDYSYMDTPAVLEMPRTRQQISQDLGYTFPQQEQRRTKTGPIQAPGKTNSRWAEELAEILLNITNGNLNKLHPNSLPYNEYYNLMMKVASGGADKVWREVVNSSSPIIPGDWRGNAYFSSDGTFLGIDLTGNSISNNQAIIINGPLPNNFYIDPLNKIINPNAMLTMNYEYLDAFLIRNKNKTGIDKIAEKIFTRIGESVGVQNGVKLGGDKPNFVAAYTDQNTFQVYVNEDLQEDLWKDYRNINALRNLLYHESLHQKYLIANYYDHADIYLQQLTHESFPNSGRDYQVEQIQIFAMYVLRAAKEPGADLEKVKQLLIDFNNNLVRPNYEIQDHLDEDNPYIIFYGERINYSDDDVQELQIN